MSEESDNHEHETTSICLGCLIGDQIELFWNAAEPLAKGLLYASKNDLQNFLKTLPLDPDVIEDQIELLQSLENTSKRPIDRPEQLLECIWDLLAHDFGHCDSHSEWNAQLELIVGMLSMDCAAQYHEAGKVHACFCSCSRAHMHLGMALVHAGVNFSRDSVQYAAKQGGDARVSKDPKQRTKLKAKAYWDRWQSDPSLYRGPEAYAKDMYRILGPDSDLPDIEAIQNMESLRRWHRQWREERDTTQQDE